MKRILHRLPLVAFFLLCSTIVKLNAQETLNLAGTWSFAIDSLEQGIQQHWFNQDFDNKIIFPGTLDQARIGKVPSVSVDTPSREVLLRLSRRHTYIGPAWYTKEIHIPANWKGKHIELYLERVIWNTRLWVNGKEAGTGESLSAPQRFEVGALLVPGKNRLTFRIDNRKQYDISHRDMAHAYTEGTQVMWNGVIGELKLMAHQKIRIERTRLFPAFKDGKVLIETAIQNDSEKTITAQLDILILQKGKKVSTRKISIELPAGRTLQKEIIKIRNALPWDEFHQNLYTVQVSVTNEEFKTRDETTERFGLRDLDNKNSLMQVNGRRVFLRGTLECAIFPLTGHPPMDKKGWLKVFTTAKNYGLNHLRFHSWCPPKAAFEVADSLGFYLQVELPFWSEKINGDKLDTAARGFIEREALRISEEYGNHPSFCLWSMGNEIRGDFQWLASLVNALKKKDPRHLYAATTFTFDKGHGKWPELVDDFFVTQYTAKGWVRGQGIFNTIPPDFNTDYSAAIDSLPIPIISHEIGQYSIYPDLKEITKYTGVLAPLNFETIRLDLEKKRLLLLNPRFSQASGRFSVRLYKEEIERALKTKGMSGFQLLDLHDFPGQGTALIGILDAFWDSKGLVTPEEHRGYCSPVVPLLRFSKATYSNSERFEATAELANFGSSILKNVTPYWTVANQQGVILLNGKMKKRDIALGNGWELGKIEFDLESFTKAEQLTVTIGLKGTSFKNQWNFWVYPNQLSSGSADVAFAVTIAQALEFLEQGRNVLFNPDTAIVQGVEGRFTPVFWSPVHFPRQPGTMGILCDPAHPALKYFPTDFYSNWQWWDLITHSKTMILDSLPELDPLVRVIDNFFKNRKMANIIEARVGKGKLLLVTMDIRNNLRERLSARQLRYSLEKYIASPDFNPAITLTQNQLGFLLKN